MDLICTRCAEPWELDYVLHDAEEGELSRRGGVILRCPACPREEPRHDAETKAKLRAAREVGGLLGDDVDGYAAFLEDLGGGP